MYRSALCFAFFVTVVAIPADAKLRLTSKEHLAGLVIVENLDIAAADFVEFVEDTLIESAGDVVIQGVLQGRRPSQRSSGAPGADLHVRSRTRIVITGEIRGAHAADGVHSDTAMSISATAFKAVDGRAADPLLYEILVESAVGIGPGEAFRGGAGGGILLEAPVVVIDGRVVAGSGGRGGPGGDGGHGGEVVVIADHAVTEQQDARYELTGGGGGDGGAAFWVGEEYRAARGGDGGRVICHVMGEAVTGVALDLLRSRPSGSEGMAGLDALGGDGGMGGSGGRGWAGSVVAENGLRHQPRMRVASFEPLVPGSALWKMKQDADGNGGSEGDPGDDGDDGADELFDSKTGASGANGTNGPFCTNGQPGGRGGNGADATGSNGMPGTDGSSGCPDRAGGDGGDGGDGGNAKGGKGGNGGKGGDSQCNGTDCFALPGAGGSGGPGGDAFGGDGKKGGNGGLGCGPGLAGANGDGGRATGGQGGQGGQGGSPAQHVMACPHGANGGGGSNGNDTDGSAGSGATGGSQCPEC